MTAQAGHSDAPVARESAAGAVRGGSWARWAAAIAVAVSALVAACGLAPRVAVSPVSAFAIGFAAIAGGVLGTSAACPRMKPRALLGAVACGVLLLGLVLGPTQPPVLAAALVTAALLAGATLIGAVVGGAVEHPGHLLLVAIVSSAADVASVFSPQGPSAAIAQSETALSVLALSWPMLGTDAIEAMLGAGDVVFAALYVAGARAHGLSVRRTLVALALGFAAALGCVVWLEQPVPALPFLGLAFIAAHPQARRVPRADRVRAVVAAGVLFAVMLLLFTR